MDHKLKVTILYDEAEDIEKAKADEQGKPSPLAYAQVADALAKRCTPCNRFASLAKSASWFRFSNKDTSDVIFNLCEAIASSPQTRAQRRRPA